jgi:putative ABC transport system ATP-binding protein
MEMLGRLNDAGKTIIMVTHEDDIAEHAKRIIKMRDGLIIDDGPSPRMKAAQAALIGTAHLGTEAVWEADDARPNDAELGPINQEMTH